MAFASGSLNAKNFGTGGGGGLVGVGKNCRLTGFAVVEHELVKKDKKTDQIIERFGHNCFLTYTINVLDPVEDGAPSSAEQYAQIGRLPLWRLQQIGEPGDPKFPGGYLPSADNETPAARGPFVILDGQSDIWQGAEASMFLVELQGLATAAGFEDQYLDRLDKLGVAGFDGIEVVLNTKTKPKGKKAAADPNSKDRSVIIVERVAKWPWENGVQTTSTPAAAASASSKPVVPSGFPAAVPTPAAVPVAAPPAVASNQSQPAAATATDADATTIDRIKRVVSAEGGQLARKDLTGKVFAATSDLKGVERSAVMQRVNEATDMGRNWLQQAAAAGHFLLDDTSIMVIG